MSSTKAFRLSLLLLAFLAPWRALANFYVDPQDFEVTSENGRFAAKITVSTNINPSQATVYSIRDGKRRPHWSIPLSNAIRPMNAYLSNDGESLVTRDNYFNLGFGDDVVAFYNRYGQIRKWSFEEIFPRFAPTPGQKLHDVLEEKAPTLEGWLPGHGSDPMDIQRVMPFDGTSRCWTERSLIFLDSTPDTSAFCIWLGWDLRWIAWNVKTGKMLSVSGKLKNRLDERGRQLAIARLKSGGADGGAMSLLSKLRRPEDRILIEKILKLPKFDHWISSGQSFEIASSARKLADCCLANWDGLIQDFTAERLESNKYYFLGSVRLKVIFPRPLRAQMVYAYLIPEGTDRNHWRAQQPENYFYAQLDTANSDQGEATASITIQGVPPGRYWAKVVWDAATPFSNNPSDGKKFEIVCNPGPGDYVSEDSPVITVKAGVVEGNVNLNCTHPAN